MITLKKFIENIALPVSVSFKYRNDSYEISIPTVDDFIEDNKTGLLNKTVYCVEPITDKTCSGGIRLIIKLKD